MIDRVELVLFDEPFEVRKLERDHAVGSQQICHSRCEVVQVGNLRQHVVTDDEIGTAAVSYEAFRQTQSKEIDQSRHVFF